MLHEVVLLLSSMTSFARAVRRLWIGQNLLIVCQRLSLLIHLFLLRSFLDVSSVVKTSAAFIPHHGYPGPLFSDSLAKFFFAFAMASPL